mgnify:FL=1
MVMRNPSLVQSETLRRRMFRNPAVYNRNDPVGIMGSSPELMQAVMRNQRPPITDFMGQDIMYPEATNFGRRPGTGEGGPAMTFSDLFSSQAPGAGTSARRRGGNRNNQQDITPQDTTPQDMT